MIRPTRLLALLVLALASCHPERLAKTGGALHLKEQSLQFPKAWVGGFSTAVAHLVNESPATQKALLSVSGAALPNGLAAQSPFTLAVAEVQVPPGETREVRLTFQAEQAGAVSGVLHASLEQGEEQTTLLALADADPPCSTPQPCHAIQFDPQSGQCVDSVVADGTNCSDDCLLNAACRAGACVGTPRVCDDGDPCTADACEPGLGCTARASPSGCPASSDPCQVPVCTASDQCATAPADDGVACGPADCTTAHICLAGACKAVSVPEGAECGSASPCQHAGRCVDGSCQQEQPGDTRTVWSYDLPTEATLHWLALTDAQDNLYWVESSVPLLRSNDADLRPMVQATLVSVTRDGYPRYRVDLGQYPSGPDYNLKMVGLLHGDTLALFGLPNTVMALDSGSGAERWRVDLSDLVSQSYHPDRFTGWDDIHVAQMVDDDDQLVIAAIGVSHTDSTDHPWGTWIRALDWQGGNALWEWTADGRSRRLVGDAQGNLYLSLWQLDTDRGSFFANGITDFAALVDGAVYALDRHGQLRWVHQGDRALDLAAAGNRLFTDVMEPDMYCLTDQRLWYAAAGTVANELGTQVPWASFVYDWPMLTLDRAYRLGVPARTDCGSGDTDAWLRSFDMGANAEAWVYGSNLKATAISAGALSQDGSVAFATTSTDPDGGATNALLRMVNADGTEKYACPVVPFTVLSEPVAQPGRWVVGGSLNPGWRVVSYESPGFQPAKAGWSASRGNMQRTNRPR